MTAPDPLDDALATLAPTDSADGDEPVGQAVTRRLREAIIDGRLAPGAWIRQEAVARRLRTSRIPVREALRTLEIEGLVVLVPHSGARVAKLELAELTELYRIREAIEPMAIAESARSLDDAQIAGLRELVEAVEAARADAPRWLELDRRFHLASLQAAPLPRMLEMADRAWNSTQHYRRAHHATRSAAELELVGMEHRMILDALERRDGEDAASRLRSHIRRTRLTLTDRPEVFDA